MVMVSNEPTPEMSEIEPQLKDSGEHQEEETSKEMGITGMLLQNYGEAMNANSSRNEETLRTDEVEDEFVAADQTDSFVK